MGDCNALRWLSSIAAAKVASFQRARRMQREQSWADWLKGEGASAFGPGQSVTRRAFAFFRGPAGWVRSVVGDPVLADADAAQEACSD
eukprot:7563278-Lingulodinium_polyedra.AAC.1